jgi:hypothetical protein
MFGLWRFIECAKRNGLSAPLDAKFDQNWKWLDRSFLSLTIQVNSLIIRKKI